MKSIIMTFLFLLSIEYALAVKPADILDDKTNQTVAADGTVVRKGTIAATLANIKLFDELKAKSDNNSTKQGRIVELVKDQRELLAALNNVGMFEAFSPYEWVSDAKKEGRILVCALYLQKYPKLITPEIYTQMRALLPIISKELQPYVEEVVSAYTK